MHYSATLNEFLLSTRRTDYEVAGRWPADAVEVDEDTYQTYGVASAPEGKRRVSGNDGLPAWGEIPPPALDALATRKRRDMDAARDQAFAAGLPYDIAGEPDVVQTRPQDQINLIGLSSKAQRLLAAGDTETPIPFRGLSNINRSLTAQQMDDLTMAALAHIESIHQRSWDRKDAIDAAEKAGDRAAIEAVTW